MSCFHGAMISTEWTGGIVEDRKCLCGIPRQGQNGARYPTIPLCRDSGMAKQFEKEYGVPASGNPKV